MEESEYSFKKIEANIAGEIILVVRWGTSRSYFSGKENFGSESFGRLRQDLVGAFTTAYVIRISTFFQEGENQLENFIRLARQAGKIDLGKQEKLFAEVQNLRDETAQLHVFRQVFAHWRKNRPEPPSKPLEIAPIIDEIIRIFEEAGGRKIDRELYEKDSKQGWKDLFRISKNWQPLTNLENSDPKH
jgi:hypothetical protein